MPGDGCAAASRMLASRQRQPTPFLSPGAWKPSCVLQEVAASPENCPVPASFKPSHAFLPPPVPVDTAVDVMRQLKEHGRVIRPYVGIKMLQARLAGVGACRGVGALPERPAYHCPAACCGGLAGACWGLAMA